MYQTPFYLTKPVGNNAFSYDLRTRKTLYVSSVIEGDFHDVEIGDGVVFEDVDEKGVLQSCKGLRNFVRMEWEGIPLVVFDNHNHALYFWYEALSQGTVGAKNTLVHIDEHSDLWENTNNLPNNPTLEQVFEFTAESCNVGNYIQPAIRSGIIEKVLRIEDSVGMEKYAAYSAENDESIILNLDLDFFAPELDYISFEEKKRIILHFARQAKLITVATSPFFIDQKRAIAALGEAFGL